MSGKERAYLIRKVKRLRVILDHNTMDEIEEFKYQELLYFAELELNYPELQFAG